MNIDEVRKLIRLVEKSEIGELEVSRKGWGRVRISRAIPAGMNGTAYQPGGHPADLRGLAGAAPPAAPVPEAKPVDDTAGLTPITSPMVGTFYRAPAPDADPYVETGDRVEPGQTLCIIEAMKLMNEIQAEIRGKVARILPANGQPVEYGQTLFLVDERA